MSSETDFTPVRVGEMDADLSDLAEAADLAETAWRIVQDIRDGRQPDCRLDSVAWRLADALWCVRQECRARGIGNVPGIDAPTGRQARLAT